jgi:hypothetical protein
MLKPTHINKERNCSPLLALYLNLAVITITVAVVALPVQAWGQSNAPINIPLAGYSISMRDVQSLANAISKLRPKIIYKNGSSMPSESPLVFYAGLDSARRPTLWILRTVPRHLNSAFNDAYVSALSLAAIEVGKAGILWETIYKQTPAGHEARIALGMKIANVFRLASDQQVVYTSKQVTWLRTHVIGGLKRSVVYALLKAHGLVAYNPAFVKGKPTPGEPAVPGHPGIGGGCDKTDLSSGAWPYQGETLPRQKGVCALIQTKNEIRNPDAEISLPGAFDLVCSSLTKIRIIFGNADRVVRLQIDRPREVCL